MSHTPMVLSAPSASLSMHVNDCLRWSYITDGLTLKPLTLVFYCEALECEHVREYRAMHGRMFVVN